MQRVILYLNHDATGLRLVGDERRGPAADADTAGSPLAAGFYIYNWPELTFYAGPFDTEDDATAEAYR